MADNPFVYQGTGEQDYKLYCIEMLRCLKYLDYEVIDEQMRTRAHGKYGEQVAELENTETEKKELVDKPIDPELMAAKIDCTDRMLDKLLANDPDAQNNLKHLG